MHNNQTTSLLYSPVDNCIKNVYSLRKQTGTTSDELHTGSQLVKQFSFPTVHNSLVTPLFIQAFITQLSTLKITQFHLLDRWLYPQSTPPINKKNKGKMERNT
jgi:hypothetical protein